MTTLCRAPSAIDMTEGEQKIEISLVEEKHLPSIAELEKNTFFESWSEKSLALLCKESNFGVVLTVDGKVVGYGGCVTVLDEGEITNIAVDRQYRRHGYGRRVLRGLLFEAEKRKIKSVYLEVRESNTPAISLYLSEGFEGIGVRKKFYSHPVENGLMMIYRAKEAE